MTPYLLLYSHCIIVKGSSRATICDLQRKNIHLVPNSLADLFIDNRYIDKKELYGQVEEDDLEIVNEYLGFLEEMELVFPCTSEELALFPAMSEEWLFPAHISNCVLDTTGKYDYFDADFLSQLNDLCCNYIQFRFFKETTIDYLQQLLGLIDRSQIKSIEILLPEIDEPGFYEQLLSFVQAHKKIGTITVYGAGESGMYHEGMSGMGFIMRTTTEISSATHCGVIDPSLFSINVLTYTESLAHNTCLNKKISIDADGRIKNCPSMKEHFGNIQDTTLAEAVMKNGFKKYWDITKDQITRCKDCEFRHVCTDCRAYVDNPGDLYAAPLKCGYDPYICEWEEWSTNPLKQQAIAFYGMHEPVKL